VSVAPRPALRTSKPSAPAPARAPAPLHTSPKMAPKGNNGHGDTSAQRENSGSYGGASMPKPNPTPAPTSQPAPNMNMGMSLEEQAKKKMEAAFAGFQAAKDQAAHTKKKDAMTLIPELKVLEENLFSFRTKDDPKLVDFWFQLTQAPGEGTKILHYGGKKKPKKAGDGIKFELRAGDIDKYAKIAMMKKGSTTASGYALLVDSGGEQYYFCHESESVVDSWIAKIPTKPQLKQEDRKLSKKEKSTLRKDKSSKGSSSAPPPSSNPSASNSSGSLNRGSGGVTPGPSAGYSPGPASGPGPAALQGVGAPRPAGPPAPPSAAPSMPSGWTEYFTDEGRPYYHNENTNQTVWVRPTE